MKFKYSFSCSNEQGDFEAYVHDIRVEIMAWDEEIDDDTIAGYAEMTYWNRMLSLNTCRYHPFEICDNVSDHMVNLYNAIFNEEDPYFLKESVAKQLSLDNEMDGLIELDICLVNRIVIYPKYRGQGLLRELFKNLGSQIGTRALIAGIPFPLQFEAKRFRQKDDNVDNYFKETELEKATLKIKKHYIKNGLVEVSSAPGWLFLTPYSLPVQVYESTEL